MIRKYHNHTLQTNPQHREEEPQNTKSHKTSMERYEHYTCLTRSGNTKTAAFWIMHIALVEIYLLFNRSCTTNDLKLFTFCLCKLLAIIFCATSCPNYAQRMTRYQLELLYRNEAHPATCGMLETGAMAIRRTNRPFFRTLWKGI